MIEFELTGPRGDNPLGFLAALGAVVALEDAGWRARLAWSGSRPRLLVDGEPAGALEGLSEAERRERLLELLVSQLSRPSAGGRPADPSVELGEDLNKPNAEFLAHIDRAAHQASARDRRWADLVAAYGVADAAEPEERMSATPWALVSGSGHQHFLGSVAQLMTRCGAHHFERALFGPWLAEDKKFSLRLDLAEDRRYALMDRDPSADTPLTIWGANRLAFEALRLFPAMPVRGGIAVRAWRGGESSRGENWRVRWPLWTPPAGAPVIGSLLSLPELWRDEPESRSRLRTLGVHVVYESRRIKVGEGSNVKYNLTPPLAVWRS
ncbi:MAG TPA: hypothetical protein VNJ11_08105 [Bryobacteraceae bacterium]|nr:hypothetical protein [Bryobacteraceae bacterium]